MRLRLHGSVCYAHLYYRTPDGPGGMEFLGAEEPAAPHFALATRTAFATSDVSVSSGRVRRAVLAHSVLAFYNATILALVITSST